MYSEEIHLLEKEAEKRVEERRIRKIAIKRLKPEECNFALYGGECGSDVILDKSLTSSLENF